MISFQNVYKSFGNNPVLKGVSFAVQEGQIVFVLGTSGTGKSVLLKNIVGLMQPSSGEIWIDGEEVSRLSEERLVSVRKKCGMVFQHPALFDSLSVLENVAFGLRRHHPELSDEQIAQRVRSTLSLVQLRGIEEKLPQQISFGMQKRVSLARTIAINPKILLFDEPTTGLDPVTTNAINVLIFELSRKLKTTSMVVSHDMQCALDIADHILVLDKGEIIAQGNPDELKLNPHPLVRDFLNEAMNANRAN